jgi:hypothetical protein
MEVFSRVVCTQSELAKDATERFGIQVSRQSVSKILQAKGITRKRVTVGSTLEVSRAADGSAT